MSTNIIQLRMSGDAAARWLGPLSAKAAPIQHHDFPARVHLSASFFRWCKATTFNENKSEAIGATFSTNQPTGESD